MQGNPKDKYTEGIGRRKSAIARVRLTPGSKSSIMINERSLEKYFPVRELQETVSSPLHSENAAKYSVSVLVHGGGISAQAGAIRHGIARALVKIDEGMRHDLKGKGFLKRDPRRKERKKYGLKKARKAPQWSKR